jgi:acetate kinase
MSMRILTINAGSSSVKFSVFDMDSHKECFDSETERASCVEKAMIQIPAALEKAGQHRFDAIGQRVAHGGEKFKDACIIDDAVIADIEACVPLAPMHNPPALAGIAIARKTWKVPQVAVFDTAFHKTIEPHATTYAVPESWRKTGVRRYGFHGTSHNYIMERVAEELKKTATALRIISCHLGNGASVCAIKHGKSIDTSMGMTPLEGLVMGTRSGDVDPGIFVYLKHTLGLTAEQIESALYKESGLAGLSGISNDVRDIEKQANAGNAKPLLALEIYAYRVKKYIGSYAAAMDGVDVVSFTGGVGENSADIRKRICTGLEFFGLHFDQTRNAQIKLTGFEAPHLHAPHSQIKVFVTKTREQWMIARDTQRILKGKIR